MTPYDKCPTKLIKLSGRTKVASMKTIIANKKNSKYFTSPHGEVFF